MCVHGRTARTHFPHQKTLTATHAMGLRSPSCLRLLLLLVPAALMAAECSIEPCTGQPDCTDCGDGQKVPDPENCRGFYICSAGEPTLNFDCNDGQIFSSTTHECIEGEECDSCPVVPPTSSCSFECVADGPKAVSSFTDCHSYYDCDGATATAGTCDASTPFFNGEKCQTDERLCCHCHPYCRLDDDVGTVVPDPLDCRSYYLCEASGEVPTVHGTCPDGENFDLLYQGCSTAAACATRLSCLNVVGADGCIDPFTCVSVGFFARCPNQCTADYYHCTAATGTFQGVESCGVGTVFHPDNHNCDYPANCPY